MRSATNLSSPTPAPNATWNWHSKCSQERVDALFVQVDPFFTERRGRIADLAAQHSLPAIYALREFVHAGGLMSYGTSITDANRQLGVYAGQVRARNLPICRWC